MKSSIFKAMAIIMGIVTSLSLPSCSDDDIDLQREVTIPTDANLMELEMWSYEIPFEVKTNSKWRIETEGDFCYSTAAEGEGDAIVKLCIVDNNEDTQRNGKLNVIFPEDESKNLEYTLRQKCASDYDDNFTISDGNKKYGVGYGYNATGAYATQSGLTRPILKFAELADSGYIVYGSEETNAYSTTITGSTATEISNELAVKAGVSGKYGGFSGEVKSSFNSNNFSSSTHEYAIAYSKMTIRPIYVELNIEEIRSGEHMMPQAYKAINLDEGAYPSNREGFKKLIQDYGTHIVLSARLGGRVRYSMSVDISKISDAYDINAYAEASYKGAFVKTNGSVDETYKKSFENNKKNCEIRIDIVGGSADKMNALNDTFDENNLKAWQNSITESNMTFVDFGEDSNTLVPLYEIIDKIKYPDRYKKLKAYMEGTDIEQDFQPIGSTYDCGTVTKFQVPNFSNDGSLVKEVTIDGQLVALVCEEFIPVINVKNRVKVVYPVIDNKPRANMGYFLGNASHKPARVSWNGSNVTVREYQDEQYFGDGSYIYLRGANISSSPMASSKNGKVADYGFVTDFQGWTTHKYSVVKIFDKLYQKDESWMSTSNDGKYHFHQYHTDLGWTYSAIAARDEYKFAPVGWRIPSKADYELIKSTLANAGISNIGSAFAEGGILGFNCHTLWHKWAGKQDDGTARYWTRDGSGSINKDFWASWVVINPKSGAFMTEDVKVDKKKDEHGEPWHYHLMIRCVKDFGK